MSPIAGAMSSVRKASWATMSRTAALCTASAPLVPHAKGPWLATRTAGIESGSIPALKNVSTITRPVSSSYSPPVCPGVKGRVQGMVPRK